MQVKLDEWVKPKWEVTSSMTSHSSAGTWRRVSMCEPKVAHGNVWIQWHGTSKLLSARVQLYGANFSRFGKPRATGSNGNVTFMK